MTGINTNILAKLDKNELVSMEVSKCKPQELHYIDNVQMNDENSTGENNDFYTY